ncbi:MAG TPA: tryptophan transporter, partial [Bacillota bacterium]|nr:tryptophan transporter [Bacillota bacterium]
MRTNAKTRDLALAGLMIAAGVVLHSFPPIIGGMKPDFSLIMLILYALLRRDKKVTLAAGLATGVITAITTGFPGGQIPNVIDKTLTTLMLLGITALPES